MIIYNKTQLKSTVKDTLIKTVKGKTTKLTDKNKEFLKQLKFKIKQNV